MSSSWLAKWANSAPVLSTRLPCGEMICWRSTSRSAARRPTGWPSDAAHQRRLVTKHDQPFTWRIAGSRASNSITIGHDMLGAARPADVISWISAKIPTDSGNRTRPQVAPLLLDRQMPV